MQRYEELWDYRRFRPVFPPLPFNRTMFTGGGGGGIKAVVRDSQQSRLFVSCACVWRVGCLLAECRQVLHFHLSSGAQKKSDSMVPSSSFLFYLFFFFLPRTRGKLNLQDFLCSRLVFPIISRILIADKSEIDCDIK